VTATDERKHVPSSDSPEGRRLLEDKNDSVVSSGLRALQAEAPTPDSRRLTSRALGLDAESQSARSVTFVRWCLIGTAVASAAVAVSRWLG
jgi:hypothetical protein